MKYDFNCILIDKDGIHHLDLKSDDPIGSMEASEGEASGKKSGVDVPQPPLDVGVGAVVA